MPVDNFTKDRWCSASKAQTILEQIKEEDGAPHDLNLKISSSVQCIGILHLEMMYTSCLSKLASCSLLGTARRHEVSKHRSQYDAKNA